MVSYDTKLDVNVGFVAFVCSCRFTVNLALVCYDIYSFLGIVRYIRITQFVHKRSLVVCFYTKHLNFSQGKEGSD